VQHHESEQTRLINLLTVTEEQVKVAAASVLEAKSEIQLLSTQAEVTLFYILLSSKLLISVISNRNAKLLSLKNYNIKRRNWIACTHN
jgi:hypothetical protein